MHLSGDELRKLRLAITSAYPSKADLMIMAREKLEVNLDGVAGGKDDTEVVFNLIQWAESRGELEQLIESLCKERPKNEVFKKIKYKLFPNFFDHTDVKPNICAISTEQWRKLLEIIAVINLDILKKICKDTLQNYSKYQDALGNCPELIQPKNLGIFKTILLEKYPKNDKGIPSLLEFAERLSKEEEISQNIRDELNNWVKTVAQELNISLPTYEIIQLSTTILNSYLLITVTPNSTDTFYLQAELILNYLDKDTNTKPIKLELNSDSPNIECSLSDIVDKICLFISLAKREYLPRGYNLTIEIFLPLQFIDANLDLKDIPIGFDKQKPLGNEYRFLVRSLERFTSNDGEYANRLYSKWDKFNYWIQNSSFHRDIQNKIHHISKVDDCNYDEIEVELEIKEKFGVKITCCLPENQFDKKDLFIAILRGGIPIFLWTRCNLPNVDDDFNNLLKFDFFQNELTRIESVWKLRKLAHAKRDKENHLGYHLGFLCDNPHRVPFNLMLQNQSLIETGM